jgi:hypothetical protein
MGAEECDVGPTRMPQRWWCRHEQGRSRRRTITPVLASKSSGGPLSRYLVLHQSVAAARHCYIRPLDPFRFIKPAMSVASSFKPHDLRNADCLYLTRTFSFDAMVQHLLTEAARCAESGKAGQVHHHSWQNCGQQMALRLKAADAELGSRALSCQAATGYAGVPVSNPPCLRPPHFHASYWPPFAFRQTR